jgi:hypothetical protein
MKEKKSTLTNKGNNMEVDITISTPQKEDI